MSEEHATEAGQLSPNVASCTCGAPAVFAFTWPWGETGYVCSRCSVSVTNRGEALGRPAVMTPLVHAPATPLNIDERRDMHARVLAANDEVAAVKARNLELFRNNQTLTTEISRLQLEADELRSQVADARAEAEQLTKEKMDALRQLAETNHELARLEGVLRAAESAP